jgi:conjugative transfer signal peptidase TraF
MVAAAESHAMTRIILAVMCSGVAATAVPPWIGSAPIFVWNVSASVPIGLYHVTPPDRVRVTDLVVVEPPPALADFLAERNYLPRGVPLLKRVIALPGQTVCRRDHVITVDGIEVGAARESDHRGRALPVWEGCRTLASGEIFVMNWQSTNSLDGRYFGPIAITSVVGRATPLWTDEEATEE